MTTLLVIGLIVVCAFLSEGWEAQREAKLAAMRKTDSEKDYLG